jgi:hypothetical protein
MEVTFPMIALDEVDTKLKGTRNASTEIQREILQLAFTLFLSLYFSPFIMVP